MKEKLKIWWLYVTVFITGAAVLVIEILGTRVLAPFYGSTIFVWSSLITVTLGALALGYFIGGRVADKNPKKHYFYSIVFIAGLLTVLLIKISEPVLLFSDKFGFQWGPLVATFVLFSLPLFFLGMVTPFAIRLRVSSLEHTGHVSGTIFAVATIGSVVGAVVSGFYLIPNFSVSDIFIFLALFLIAISLAGLFLEKSSRKLLVLALTFLSAVYFFPQQSQEIKAKILYEEPSFYGDIKVVERDGLRCLIVDSQGQSCIRVKSGEQALAYGNLISGFLLMQGKKGHALVIGLGGGVISQDIAEGFDKVIAVEIDPKIVEAAEHFFGYDAENEKLRTVIADGRRFLREDKTRYDAIVLDAFSGVSPAPHLYTKEVFQEMKDRLSLDGLLVINTIGYTSGTKAELQKALAKTLRAVFPSVLAVSTSALEKGEETFGNIVFVASENGITFRPEDEFLVRFAEKELEEAALLADAHNPMEILGIPAFEESRKNYQRFLGNL